MLALILIAAGLVGLGWGFDAFRRRRAALTDGDPGLARFESVNLGVGAIVALAAIVLLMSMGRPA